LCGRVAVFACYIKHKRNGMWVVSSGNTAEPCGGAGFEGENPMSAVSLKHGSLGFLGEETVKRVIKP
jgi:hypothetical protein